MTNKALRNRIELLQRCVNSVVQ